jgi:hypothetical protein
MRNQRVTITADTLELARNKAKSMIPHGLKIRKEKIIFTGNETKSERGIADTEEDAFKVAMQRISPEAHILQKKSINSSSQSIMSIKAFDEKSAKSSLEGMADKTVTIKSIKLDSKGKNILGLWKTPNLYSIEVFQPFVVEVSYRPKCEIEVVFGGNACGKCGRTWDGLESHFAAAKAKGAFIYGEGSPVLLFCDKCNQSYCGGCQADLGIRSGCPNCRQAID